jgi:uncharacterized protein YbaP (TraB family)
MTPERPVPESGSRSRRTARQTPAMPKTPTILYSFPLALLMAAMPSSAATPPATAVLQPPTEPASAQSQASEHSQAPAAEPAPDDEDAGSEDDALTTLETVVVSGIQPGPGLWKVSSPDGNVMWVLGTLTPLPKRMEWNSEPVEARIATAGVVLMSPRVSMSVGLGGVFLIPSAMRARNNPDKETLEDVLPPDDYARWQALKARYLGRDRGVEKRRPIVAAMELREKAFDRADLSWRDVVGRTVNRAAKRHDVPIERPTVAIRVEDPRAALKEFSGSTVDDLACFRQTLDQVDRDLDTLAARANAWALGQVAMLRELPYTDNTQACADALLQTGMAQRRGFTDLPAKVEQAWLAAAEAALAEHPESFAVLPMSRIIGGRAYLRILESRGYVVEAPAD